MTTIDQEPYARAPRFAEDVMVAGLDDRLARGQES
jgi:hypothetical protein